MAAISISSILTSLAKVTLVGLILNELRDLPVRMNHYTRWEIIPLITSSGIANPSGDNYFTPDWYFTGPDAKAALALDKEPEVFINLVLYPKRDKLEPQYPFAHPVDGGTGREYWTSKPIPFWTRFPVIIPLF